MSLRALPPGAHVILGDSAAGTFRRAFRPGDRLLIDRDVLSCGPTPRCADVAHWCEVRREFWHHAAPTSGPQPESSFGLLSESDRLPEAEQVTIWTATGVSEQLFVAHVLHRAEEIGVAPAKICVVQFETARGRAARVIGTGELNEQQMSEHPQPAPIPAAALQDYRDAWTALTSPDPVLMERYGETHPRASEWLQRAMQRLLRRFPDKRTGLPWWDFALLSEARLRPNAARVIGCTMASHWDEGDPVGDFYLFARLLRLGAARLRAPLLEISGDRMHMRNVQVALTAFGRDVLEGKASNHPTNPIDDWASGVKLSSADGALWFNDGGRLLR
jgi:uncharacterized protein DUF1835